MFLPRGSCFTDRDVWLHSGSSDLFRRRARQQLHPGANRAQREALRAKHMFQIVPWSFLASDPYILFRIGSCRPLNLLWPLPISAGAVQGGGRRGKHEAEAHVPGWAADCRGTQGYSSAAVKFPGCFTPGHQLLTCLGKRRSQQWCPLATSDTLSQLCTSFKASRCGLLNAAWHGNL